MTNIEDITIFDEIVNCGILEEDSVVVFGAGHQDGKFLDTLIEYNGSLGQNLVTAVDADHKKIKMLSKKFKGESLLLKEVPMQDFLEDSPVSCEWTVITGIFDTFLYGENQYDFVSNVVSSTLQHCNKGLVFTIKENVSEEFKYSMIYFFTDFADNYQRFTVKKFNDGNYIFCIFK